ncbi:hypothetical protein Ctha_1650 [Chloroherpeton thalassium ATCC 35110]|uniref:TonB family protein n=1 Tax=Chloroherpeton thalassium (strain ATCC 35110 / GB-78) TaxID=517418 RepID=B3QSR1_CHLT3|nr:carboxypeptidase-like regulatory domain-containing protein [Chloroherpeton thalassium]ACF14108.1 hypothetical protein Ctha_1650 [Chloroherpeton thalassium ATCC 35110]
MNQRFWTYLFAISFLVLLPTVVSAQARLLGQVTDADGNPIVAAIVSLSGKGRTGAVLTNSQGFYTFLSLPVGEYSVRAVKSGKQSRTFNFSLADKTTVMMNLNISPEAILQEEKEESSVVVDAGKKAKKTRVIRQVPKKVVRKEVAEKANKKEEKPVQLSQNKATDVSKSDDVAVQETEQEVLEIIEGQVESENLEAALRVAEEEEMVSYSGFEKSPEIIGGVEEIYKYLEYPLSARNTPKPVMVIAKVFVDQNGYLKRVDMLKNGPRVFNEEVYRVLTEKIKYKPADVDSKPIPGSLTFVVNFSPETQE